MQRISFEKMIQSCHILKKKDLKSPYLDHRFQHFAKVDTHSSCPTFSLSKKWQRIEVSKNKSCNQSSEATWGGGAGGIFLFCWGSMGCVELLLFLLRSHQIPNGFPTNSPSFQHVPIGSSIYRISFALSSTLENVYKQPKVRDYSISILVLSTPFIIIIIICDELIKDAQLNLVGPDNY